ncbi:MAG: hypothetical protein P4L45_16185 [Ignavibacteriaceae bacterium]|nr:hypothetical protein [Ignavibacteriaceae bacterium]
MTLQTETLPINISEMFSANVKYLGGDMMKFETYQLKRAFGVFVTLDE